MERQLSKIEDIDVIGTFMNPSEGTDFIIRENADVIFLDIDMSPISGMEIAERIIGERPDVQIVFVTAYEQYAVEAFELNASDYIVKPVRLDRLKVTVERIRKRMIKKGESQEDGPDLLRIRTAPFLAVEARPDVFEPFPWRTAKSEELFIYFLEHHGSVIEKSAIIDLLWSEYDVEKAYSLLYTTIYNIRKQLKPYVKHMKLHNHSYGYMLELKKVEIDREKWEHEAESLPELDSKSVADYERVMAGYRGPYLAKYDYTWLEAERHRLDRLWTQLATRLAHYYMDEGDHGEAIRWYIEMTEQDPTREEAHFQLMKLYEATGDFTAMMQQYNVLHRVYREHFDMKPSEHIKDWYLEKLK
jgi:two-component SAPR family response regulator